MKRIWTLLFMSLALVFVLQVAAEAAEDMSPNMVRMYASSPLDENGRGSYGPSGSGFWIEGGYLVSSAHMVQMKSDWTFGWAGETYETGWLDLVAVDEERDLSLFKAQDRSKHLVPETDLLTLAEAVEYGEEVKALGNRELRTGKVIAASEEVMLQPMGNFVGVISTTTRNRLVLDLVAEPGYSGSAVVNSNGEVIGVIIAGYMDSMRSDGTWEGRAIGVTLDDLRDFLEEHMPEPEPIREFQPYLPVDPIYYEELLRLC